MITPTDIACIVYRDCEPLGLSRVPDGCTLAGPLEDERCVIHVKEQQTGKYWRNSFVEVNLCVPDLRTMAAEADTIRLGELEHAVQRLWGDGLADTYDGTPYHYQLHTLSVQEDRALRCHFVSARLLFEVLNVME